MASITKRDNGKWRARYRDPDGKEHARHFDRKADATRWLDEVTAAVVTGQYVDPKAGQVSFRDYSDRWRKVQPHRAGTAALYERVLRLHVYPVFGERCLSSLRHSDAQAFVAALSRRLAPNTARQVHAITRTICRSAVHDRLIASSPFSKIKLPAVTRGRVTPPTMGELRRAADAAPKRLGALVVLAAATGLRSGELLGLSIDRVDFLRREVRVDRQLVYVPGQPPYLGPPKTPESERVVPLPTFAVEALAAHLTAFPAGPDGLIFQADKGGPVLRTTLHGRWRATLRRAGLDEGVHFHHARHAYATTLTAGGVPFTTTMELLGHAPTGITWAVYTHRAPGWDRQVRNVLETAWSDDGADSVRTAEAL